MIYTQNSTTKAKIIDYWCTLVDPLPYFARPIKKEEKWHTFPVMMGEYGEGNTVFSGGVCYTYRGSLLYLLKKKYDVSHYII